MSPIPSYGKKDTIREINEIGRPGKYKELSGMKLTYKGDKNK
jgi:hypothetical protein